MYEKYGCGIFLEKREERKKSEERGERVMALTFYFLFFKEYFTLTLSPKTWEFMGMFI